VVKDTLILSAAEMKAKELVF